jgi:cytochrome c551/c552
VNPTSSARSSRCTRSSPRKFDGFDYAVLANNINCIFCHTQVDSVDRVYNTDIAAKWARSSA